MQTHTLLFADGAGESRQEHLSSLITWSYKLPISPHILQLQYKFNKFKSPTAHNTTDIYSILMTTQHPIKTIHREYCMCVCVSVCHPAVEASASSGHLTPGGRSDFKHDIRTKKAHGRLQGLSQTEAQTLNLTVERVIVVVLHQKQPSAAADCSFNLIYCTSATELSWKNMCIRTSN